MRIINLVDLRHSVRVANMCKAVGASINLPHGYAHSLYIACLFHDIGKAHLDQRILNKTERLTSDERDHLHAHSLFGQQEMTGLGFSAEIADIVLHHHENFDGSGYPDGLSGCDIPLGSRILRVADVYDALTMDRPYRGKLSYSQALDVMAKERSHFDPSVYREFLRLLPSLSDVRRKTPRGLYALPYDGPLTRP